MKKKIKWSKRIGLGLIILLLLLLFIGFFFEKASRNKAEKINPNGNFVNLENHCFHYYKKDVVDQQLYLKQLLIHLDTYNGIIFKRNC